METDHAAVARGITLNIRYTDHAAQRMAQRRIPEFRPAAMKVARAHVLREIRHFCAAHTDVTTPESEFVYWHRRRDRGQREVFVSRFDDETTIVIITAFIMPIVDFGRLNRKIKTQKTAK